MTQENTPPSVQGDAHAEEAPPAAGPGAGTEVNEGATGREPGNGGESNGGAYPNPHTGKKSKDSGFFGSGGQTDNSYSGPDNPNSTTE